MALQFAHGVVSWLAADAATTVYTVSGLPFAPKAIRFYWMGLGGGSSTSSAAIHWRRGVGFAVSPSLRRCAATMAQDNVAAAVNESIAHTTAIAATLSGAGAVDGLLDINSFTSDGFTLIVDDQVPVNIDVFWEAWGGDGVTGATIIDIAEPAATGNVDYVTPGITPAVVMFAGVQATALDTLLADSDGLSVGFASSGLAANNVVAFSQSDDGSTTPDTDRYVQTGECLTMMILANAGTVNARATLSQFNQGGFRLNWLARATSNRRSFAMALAGGQWAVGALTIEGNSGSATATVSSLPFTPCGMSFLGCSMAAQAAGTALTEGKLGLGTGSSVSSRESMGGWDEDALGGNQEVNLTMQYAACLAFPDGAGALAEAIDIDAVTTDGFRLIVDTAGGVASEWIGYLACGGKAPTALENYKGAHSTGLAVSGSIR